MAMVQYQVLYRYVHPTTKKVSTNTTAQKYEASERFCRAYSNTTGINTQDVLAEQSPDNAKYDMLFIYDGVQEINSFLSGLITNAHVVTEKFQRCKGEGWFVASTQASLQASLNAADALVRTLGKENVKVVKIVPLDITVGLE